MKKSKFEKFGSKNTLNKNLLINVKGGADGKGWWRSVSGDCNSSGRSCWDALEDILVNKPFWE